MKPKLALTLLLSATLLTHTYTHATDTLTQEAEPTTVIETSDVTEEQTTPETTAVHVPTEDKAKIIVNERLRRSQDMHVQCLAENIYHEAGNQSGLGKIAVGMVTLNRVKEKNWPSTVCDVVTQKVKVRNKVVCQFSWVCSKGRSLLSTLNPQQWKDSLKVAMNLLVNNEYVTYKKTSLGSVLYFNSGPVPFKGLVYVTSIEDHRFYR